MSTPLTLENILAIFGVVVTVVGLLKALEWVIDKFNHKHDKEQQIDANSEDLDAYKKKTNTEIDELRKTVLKLEKNINDALADQKADYMKNLKADKEEYLEGIRRVEASILEMQAVYQQTIAVFDVKLEALTKQVEKHNSVVERTFILERDVAVLNQRETASEKRLRELEDDRK